MHQKLKRLLKLYRFLLDQKRVELAEKRNEKQTLENRLETLLSQLKEERALAATDPLFLESIQSFKLYVDGQQALISSQIQGLEEVMHVLETQIQKQFSDLKSIELALEQRTELEGQELARKETAVLDEIALRKCAMK